MLSQRGATWFRLLHFAVNLRFLEGVVSIRVLSEDACCVPCRAGVAQLVEHLICNQRVGGSSPFAGSRSFSDLRGVAGVVEWLMAPGCKPGRLTPYVGSNPTPCTMIM